VCLDPVAAGGRYLVTLGVRGNGIAIFPRAVMAALLARNPLRIHPETFHFGARFEECKKNNSEFF
jgi:hypothetical protein